MPKKMKTVREKVMDECPRCHSNAGYPKRLQHIARTEGNLVLEIFACTECNQEYIKSKWLVLFETNKPETNHNHAVMKEGSMLPPPSPRKGQTPLNISLADKLPPIIKKNYDKR